MRVLPARRDPLPPEVAALYPFAPRFVPVAGGGGPSSPRPSASVGGEVEIAIVDEGPRADEAVVLLHGNPTWGFLYRAFVPPLVAAGHRVVVPDHAGCGRSSKPTDPSYYSLDCHVENLERVLDAAGVRRATLVLHDWGGPIGLGWAARHPNRVARLVVLNTAAFVPRRKRALSTWHRVFAGPANGLLGQRLNLILESAMRFGVVHRDRMRGPVLRAYRWPFPTAASRAGIARWVRLVPDGPDHPTVPALRAIEAAFPKLSDVPAIVLWGDRDPVFSPAWAERWREKLPGIRRVERFAAGHFLQEDEPAALADAIVRFLGEP